MGGGAEGTESEGGEGPASAVDAILGDESGKVRAGAFSTGRFLVPAVLRRKESIFEGWEKLTARS
jgi:hypothetical protein